MEGQEDFPLGVGKQVTAFVNLRHGQVEIRPEPPDGVPRFQVLPGFVEARVGGEGKVLQLGQVLGDVQKEGLGGFRLASSSERPRQGDPGEKPARVFFVNPTIQGFLLVDERPLVEEPGLEVQRGGVVGGILKEGRQSLFRPAEFPAGQEGLHQGLPRPLVGGGSRQDRLEGLGRVGEEPPP